MTVCLLCTFTMSGRDVTAEYNLQLSSLPTKTFSQPPPQSASNRPPSLPSNRWRRSLTNGWVEEELINAKFQSFPSYCISKVYNHRIIFVTATTPFQAHCTSAHYAGGCVYTPKFVKCIERLRLRRLLCIRSN